MSGVTIFAFSHEFLLDCKFIGTQRSNVSQCGSWCLKKDFLYALEASRLIRSSPKKKLFICSDVLGHVWGRLKAVLGGFFVSSDTVS